MKFKKLQNNELFLYGIIGLVTSILNISLYTCFIYIQVDYKVANMITLIFVKIAAYILNKYFVFKTKTNNSIALIKEFMRFVATRVATMLIDFCGLIILVEIFDVNNFIGKILITVIVIIINYLLSKKYVFR